METLTIAPEIGLSGRIDDKNNNTTRNKSLQSKEHLFIINT